MKPCENVIVTVQLENGQIDMELPVFLDIKTLLGKMLETFKVIRPEKYSACNTLRLMFQGYVLDEQYNLASYGIWDGSIISCVIE